MKRLDMFPFKVQLFQGCKSETEPINTKSVVQHVIRYQVLLEAYYKADTNYCCCRATCLSDNIVDFTIHTHTHTHINRLYKRPSIIGGILQSVLNLIQCLKVLRYLINNFKICYRIYIYIPTVHAYRQRSLLIGSRAL
jgi:hypothetical protein